MSDQGQSGQGRASGIGDQIDQVRQRVMDSNAVKTIQERVQAEGPELVERVKALAQEAGVRRISIQHDGRILFEFPLAIGLVGALIAPQLAALGAVAALVSNCTIAVEREAASSTNTSTGTGASASGASSHSAKGNGSSASSKSGADSSSSSASGSTTAHAGSSTGGTGSPSSTGPGGAMPSSRDS